MVKIWVNNKNCAQKIRQLKVPKLNLPNLHFPSNGTSPTVGLKCPNSRYTEIMALLCKIYFCPKYWVGTYKGQCARIRDNWIFEENKCPLNVRSTVFYHICLKIDLPKSPKDCAPIMACDDGGGYEDCMQFAPFDDTVWPQQWIIKAKNSHFNRFSNCLNLCF